MAGVECVHRSEDLLGEGPLWSVREQCLYRVDIRAPALHRLDPVTGSQQSWPMPEPIGSAALGGDGRVLVALASGLSRFDPDGGALQPLVPIEAEIATSRLNDGRCDRQGRFWVGSMDRSTPAGRGALYRYDPDGALHRMLENIEVPNSLAFSPDGGTMYFADSPTREVQAFALSAATGELTHRRVFARCEPPGVPDGAVTDEAGCLWVAQFDGGRLVRFRPDGAVDRVIPMPVDRPTACCFGGADLGTLFVTSARINLDAEALRRQELAGSVFALRPGVRGLPEPLFAGAAHGGAGR
jgi:L-arabinonolactonase